ncbi:MAG: ribosome biogenesis GTPase Der [Proteobacteria bacterium]|jgi:GTP-binding protein|nr:ribosome biogenesis GTPase Der [Pseudomonadota bacterium]
MLPTIALVGRPNVGKSTLFNRLTKSRNALVADIPGLTRDRHYGRARAGERDYLVVDTGGFEPVATSGILFEMAKQTRTAIAECDAVVFVVDARTGLTPQDRTIGELLRRCGRPVIVAVNKAEGMPRERATAEFHELALGEPWPVSAAHGENVRDLVEIALDRCAMPAESAPPAAGDASDADAATGGRIVVAIVGRPNVGKSTLVNALVGEERVIAFDEPGTTRDSIRLDFDARGRRYTLIDTAGVRRRARIDGTIEKFSVIKTLQSIADAHVVVLLLDAVDGISEQDAHLAGHVLEAGRALVVAINKWDAASREQREAVRSDIARKLAFVDFAQQQAISARARQGLGELLNAVDAAYAAAMARLPTPRLTRTLQQAVLRQQPPRAGMVRPKLRYAHQGGMNPPIVVIHGSALRHVPAAYRRYLEHFFADAFQLRGTPLRIEFRTGANPWADTTARR